jgi:hypothetical protein
MPAVFVGHPFKERFPVARFRAIFQGLPFKVIYGNTDLQTQHLLTIMKSNIAKSDFSIFDLSNWNPNVALELGLSEGLKKKPNKNYYIVLNTKRSKEVPSDIRGIQRLEYTSYDFKPEVGLGDQLVRYILSKEYWIKKIWKDIPDQSKGPKMRRMALRILAHFRDHEKLTPDNLRTITQGTHLRENDREQVLDALVTLKLIKKAKTGNVYVRACKIYR